MRTILWALLLFLGILTLLAAGPREAPPFETVTAFHCDSLPLFPSGGRGTSVWHPTYTCRAGNQVIYTQAIPPSIDAPRQLQFCLAAGGMLTLWRQPMGSPYGRVIFQAACAGKVYAEYRTLAANYNNSQLFIHIVAWLMMMVSASRLGVAAWHYSHRRADA